MNLFGKDERPKNLTDEQKDKLAVKIGKKICEWCNKETSLELCIEDTKEILSFNYNDNGFDLAKAYEDKGYSPDAELVYILEDIPYIRYEILNKAIEKWVIEDKIEPEFEIGTICNVKYGAKLLEGVIVDYNKKLAQYKVVIESEGMTINGSMRAIVNYEDAELIK